MVMYIDVSDLQDLLTERQLIGLTDDNRTGTIDQDIVEKAIQDASSEINTYLAHKYNVPLSPVPQIIKKLCADISVYNLFSRRAHDEVPENIRKRYEDAISLLKMLAEGKILLSADLLKEQRTTSSFVKEGGQVFSRDSLKGF